MRKISLVVLAAIPLIAAGCSKPADSGGSGGNSAEVTQQAQAVAADAAAEATTAPASQPPRTTDYGKAEQAATQPEAPRRPAPPALPMLAYAHRFMMELPGDQVRPLLNWHEQQCVEAGPSLCQVMGAETREEDGEATATLTLRGDPVWLTRFRGGLEVDAERVGGKVKATGTDTEDLTRQVVDTEAAIRAKTVLRDRLQKILATRQGKLPELLQTEQELARVQGEIDASRSELSVMRARVRTSELTIDYRSLPQLVSPRAVEPLKRSVHGVFGIVMTGLAVLITVSAVLLPFALVGVPVWLLLRNRKRPVAGRLKA